MAELKGGIEAVSGRLVTGWIDATESGQANIELLADGRLLGATLAEADEANARLVFEFMLPRTLFDGAEHEFALRAHGQAVAVANGVHRLGSPGPVSGWLEKISDAHVLGWAWYPEQPEARVEVELLVDGHVAGTAIAGLYRADVANAGKGDGCYGFSWPLPYSVLAMPRDVTITARDKYSGQALPEPRVFRQKTVVDAMGKIASLESDIRLLNATIAALEQRGAADERAAYELFKTVGDFFANLASGAAPGKSVKAAAAEITGLAPIVLPPCAAPEISVFIESGGTVESAYNALRAVASALGAAKAEVFLLDDGNCDEAALLPSVVQNLRYASLPGTAAARCNDAVRLGAAGIAVFLAAATQPPGGWMQGLAAFEKQPELAVLGPGAECFALRRAAWEKLGGLDEECADLREALAAFGQRAQAAGFVARDGEGGSMSLKTYAPSFVPLELPFAVT